MAKETNTDKAAKISVWVFMASFAIVTALLGFKGWIAALIVGVVLGSLSFSEILKFYALKNVANMNSENTGK